MSAAAKRGTEQIQDAIAAYQDAEEAQRGMQSASLNYRQQVADTAAAVAESTLIQLDAKRTDEEREQAARDAEAAVLAQADAALKLAEDQAAANGETLSADEKTRAYVEELYTLTAALSGPVRAELEAHIQRLLRVPKSIGTNVGIGGGNTTTLARPTADGGIFKARPGGHILQVAEGGHDEAVIPLSGPNAPKFTGSGGGLTVHIHAGIMPDKIQLGRLLKDAQAAYERSGGR
jgi:hypothetical protein